MTAPIVLCHLACGCRSATVSRVLQPTRRLSSTEPPHDRDRERSCAHQVDILLHEFGITLKNWALLCDLGDVFWEHSLSASAQSINFLPPQQTATARLYGTTSVTKKEPVVLVKKAQRKAFKAAALDAADKCPWKVVAPRSFKCGPSLRQSNGVLGNLTIPVPFGGSFSGKPTCEEVTQPVSTPVPKRYGIYHELKRLPGEDKLKRLWVCSASGL